MALFTAAVLVGSLRKDSYNLSLAKALVKLGQDRFRSSFVRIDDLPLYNQDLDKNFPAPALRLKDEIKKADALLIITPEYNRSIPGPLKNAIDWASRPYGENAFAGKPTAIAGTSQGAVGTACAQHSLRPVLNYLNVILLGQPELYIQFKDGLIDAESNVTNEKTKEFLGGFIEKFAAWVQQTKNITI